MYSSAYQENDRLADVCSVSFKDHVTTWASEQGRNDMNALSLAMWKPTHRKITRKKACHCYSWLTPQNGGHGQLFYLKLDCFGYFYNEKYLIDRGNCSRNFESRLF